MNTTVDVKPGAGTAADLAIPIPTARGDAVAARDLGFVAVGELIMQDSPELEPDWKYLGWKAKPEEEQIAHVVRVLNEAYEGGVHTILDRTIQGIGRDAVRMRKIAEQTKLNILMCTGLYVLWHMPYYFRFVQADPVAYAGWDRLEDIIARDVEVGIGDSGVKAAVIKVASDKWGIDGTYDVREVFRATAIAHRRTGAPITTHSLGIAGALDQQRVFTEDGVDLSRVQHAHMDRSALNAPLEDFERALDRGSLLSFDGWYPADGKILADEPGGPEDTMDRIAALLNKGWEDQISLSGGWPIAFQDSFTQSFFPDDGVKPYMRVIDKVIPGLKARGATDAQLTKLTSTNAQAWLATRSRGSY